MRSAATAAAGGVDGKPWHAKDTNGCLGGCCMRFEGFGRLGVGRGRSTQAGKLGDVARQAREIRESNKLREQRIRQDNVRSNVKGAEAVLHTLGELSIGDGAPCFAALAEVMFCVRWRFSYAGDDGTSEEGHGEGTSMPFPR